METNKTKQLKNDCKITMRLVKQYIEDEKMVLAYSFSKDILSMTSELRDIYEGEE